jgi:disulfide bond formation protein DsbB
MTALTPRILWASLAAGCAGLVLGSLVLTAWLDLQPCHLCIFQRLLFMLIATLALAAAVLTSPRAHRPFGGLVLGLGGLGVGVAAYQSWLQAQSPGSLSCVGGQPGRIERLVDWLGQQVPSLFLATGLCEEEQLVIFGLSLANWALLCFSACLGAAAWALWRGRRAGS